MSGTYLTVAGAIRCVIWAFPLVLAVIHRRPNTIAIAALYILTNVASMSGERELAGLLAILGGGGAAWLLCDRIMRLPTYIEVRWRADQAHASRERHDLRNQLAVLAAENAMLTAKLKEKE